MPLIQRRAFLTGLVSTLAAPAIVRATSIMPVKALYFNWINEAYRITKVEIDDSLYVNMVDMTRQAFVPRLWVQVCAVGPVSEMLAAFREDSPRL